MTPREENARIIMPQSGVGATPHKGLIFKVRKTRHSRVSKRHHRKGFKRNATVGRRGDITERALKESKIQQCHSRTSERHRRKGFYSQVNNTHNKCSIHENEWVSPSTGIII